MSERITHTAPLWLWTSPAAPASWHFITLDGAAGEAIAAHEALRRLELGPGSGRARGFGSVKVAATVGTTGWSTSVFPNAGLGGYMLPVKAAVRRAEGLAAGDLVTVELELL